jgi:hypothetical protein
MLGLQEKTPSTTFSMVLPLLLLLLLLLVLLSR